MPKLNKIINERDSKKFVKKSYRPWDLTGESNFSNNQEHASFENMNTHVTKTENNLLSTPPIDIELDNNTGIKRVTNTEQQESNQRTIGEQSDYKEISAKNEFREHIDINIDPRTLSNQILKLSGVQKNILNFIVDICSLRDALDTGPIETATIATCVSTTPGTVKISLRRIIDKGFVIRNKGKQAKGGYIHLALTKEVYDTVLKMRESKNRPLNQAEILNSIRYQLENAHSPISSSNYQKTITTSKKQELLPNEWLEIDYEALSHIGFSKIQIKQLIDKNEPQVVQLSIDHFAYGLEHNPKFNKYVEPLNVLMGVLRKGEGWFEQDYRSPKEIALQKLMENKKAEIERRKKLEEEIYSVLLQEWIDTLAPNKIEEIAPNTRHQGDITPPKAKLSNYFKENIWPMKKTEYLVTND